MENEQEILRKLYGWHYYPMYVMIMQNRDMGSYKFCDRIVRIAMRHSFDVKEAAKRYYEYYPKQIAPLTVVRENFEIGKKNSALIEPVLGLSTEQEFEVRLKARSLMETGSTIIHGKEYCILGKKPNYRLNPPRSNAVRNVGSGFSFKFLCDEVEYAEYGEYISHAYCSEDELFRRLNACVEIVAQPQLDDSYKFVFHFSDELLQLGIRPLSSELSRSREVGVFRESAVCYLYNSVCISNGRLILRNEPLMDFSGRVTRCEAFRLHHFTPKYYGCGYAVRLQKTRYRKVGTVKYKLFPNSVSVQVLVMGEGDISIWVDNNEKEKMIVQVSRDAETYWKTCVNVANAVSGRAKIRLNPLEDQNQYYSISCNGNIAIVISEYVLDVSPTIINPYELYSVVNRKYLIHETEFLTGGALSYSWGYVEYTKENFRVALNRCLNLDEMHALLNLLEKRTGLVLCPDRNPSLVRVLMTWGIKGKEDRSSGVVEEVTPAK